MKQIRRWPFRACIERQRSDPWTLRDQSCYKIAWAKIEDVAQEIDRLIFNGFLEDTREVLVALASAPDGSLVTDAPVKNKPPPEVFNVSLMKKVPGIMAVSVRLTAGHPHRLLTTNESLGSSFGPLGSSDAPYHCPAPLGVCLWCLSPVSISCVCVVSVSLPCTGAQRDPLGDLVGCRNRRDARDPPSPPYHHHNLQLQLQPPSSHPHLW